MTTGDFDPNLPVGEPGGWRPHGRLGGLFGPRPTAMPPDLISAQSDDFDPNALVPLPAGYRAGGVALRSLARLVDTTICFLVVDLVTRLVQPPFWLDFIIWGVFTFLYFVAFESALGWTPAKMVFGLSVRASSHSGAPNPSLSQAGTRNKFMLLLGIPYIGSLLWILFSIHVAVTIYSSPTKQGKLDLNANGTQVLRRAR